MSSSLVAFTKKGFLPQKGKKDLNDIREKLKQGGFISPTDGFSSGVCYLLLDHSGSMNDARKLQQAKTGAKDFVAEAVKKGYPVGLIKFSSQAMLVCKPTKNLSDFSSLINDIKTEGSTNMAQAIQIARKKLTKDNCRRAIVLVTDGMPDNKDETLSEIAQVKEMGIDVITIGTKPADEDFLRLIATCKELAKYSSDVGAFAGNIRLAARDLPMLTA